MLEIEGMTTEEMESLLRLAGFGHLGCARDGHPYVVPMHYAYDGEDIYFVTTEGTKTEYMAANSEVCFQIEEISSPHDWRSVMVLGRVKRLFRRDEAERARRLITEHDLELTPAIGHTEIGAWKRPNDIAVYRLHPAAIYGRKTS
jgi:nitroimidazol reductase NimA-like FMN-containing flavoprotein (pyridoxamine 5'-phosphate oxidase superfamily)